MTQTDTREPKREEIDALAGRARLHRFAAGAAAGLQATCSSLR